MQAQPAEQSGQPENGGSDKEKKSSKGESFLKGTFVLTIAGFVVKVIGSLNWIFVSRILGGEGIGLYQMAFPIYFLAMTVSQAGVPVHSTAFRPIDDAALEKFSVVSICQQYRQLQRT